MKIELARKHHLSKIPAIEQAAAAMFPEDYLPSPIRFEVTDPETLREAQAGSRLWVATIKPGKVVGFAMADVIDGQAHLDEMNVVPDFGRRGIGTELIQVVMAWAIRCGFPGLTLVTFRNLPWNAPFYEKLGFAMLRESQLGDELRELLSEEAAAGIDVSKRICMELSLEAGQAIGQ